MKPITSLYLVDAFAPGAFRGNPAAICILPAPQPTEWMQQVAAEMNQSETAFLEQRQGGAFGLRWFTPTTEVELCGHATLASAHILWEIELASPAETLRFETLSGILTARKSVNFIELDFPSEPSFESPVPEWMVAAIGVTPIHCARNRFDYLVQLESAAAVRALQPDMAALITSGTRGLIATAADESGKYDFISRFFAPCVGIPEDPVTGSAHCCLAPFWKDRLGKSVMKAYQASARGGEMEVEVKGQRVLLRGNAITIMQGVLRRSF